jgi:hypothetical protein
MAETAHSRVKHVYAIIRFDFPVDQDYPENSVAIVKVLPSKSLAEKELSRLSKLNAAKGCRYEMRTTGLIR